MMFFFCFVLIVSFFAVPALATTPELDILVTSPPQETASPTEPPITNIPEEMPMPLLITGELSGGYYFICDTSIGSMMQFYVPLEWAHDAFAVDGSGALVNMSNTTCYAYCPELPDYTFSCSRFGTFVYRGDGFSTTDLEVTNITETNIEFLSKEPRRLSDSDMLLCIGVLLFILLGYLIIKRR